MIVTKIERQKYHPQRLNIYIDDAFAFAVHNDALVHVRLHKGETIDQQAVDELKSREEFSLAKRQALRLIGYKLRSEKELRQKLIENEFEPRIIDNVIDHLRSLGIIDDRKFAQAFVHDKRLRRPSGKRLLSQHLRLKGVAQSIIEEVLSQNLSDVDERHEAYELAKKILKKYQGSRRSLEREKQKQQLMQYLARRGFSWDTISPVVKRLFADDPMLPIE